MNPFKNFDWSFKSIAKVIGALALGIVALTILISLIGFSFNTVTEIGGMGGVQRGKMVSSNFAMEAMDYDDGYYAESGMSYGGGMSVPPHINVTPTGSDAEDYEVKEYNGTIKTRKIDQTCEILAKLKSKDYVIFENSNKNENNCDYRFKVEKEKSQEIVTIIENLKPESFNANIHTIKGAIKKYENEVDILTKKLKAVEETLANAQESYDEISKIATEERNADALASIINSKLNLIEKLTNERLMIKERIDRYNKNKADQLDRLNYTFFNIQVYKDVLFDWKQIKNDWKYATKDMIRDFNDTLQGISIQLVTYLTRFVQVIIYFLISLFLLKLVWIATKRIWKGKRN